MRCTVCWNILHSWTCRIWLNHCMSCDRFLPLLGASGSAHDDLFWGSETYASGLCCCEDAMDSGIA